MKRFRLIIWTIMAACMATACSDFLKEQSQDEIIPSSAADFREILLNYTQNGIGQAIFMMDDDMAIDNDWSYWGTGDNFEALKAEGCFTWMPDMWERPNVLEHNYMSVYENIKAMNAILEKIDDANGTIEEKDIVKAQALGTRAYFYFMLVNMFGKPYNYDKDAPGVVLKLKAMYAEKGMKRATVAEVYAQIVEDLETASGLLNKYPKQRGGFMMNCTAADILLSRVYLYMEEWDKAIGAADRAIGTAEGLYDYTRLPEGHFYMTNYDNSEVEWIFSSAGVSSGLFKVSDDLMLAFSKHENDRRTEFLPNVYGGIAKTLSRTGGPNVMVRSTEAYLNRAEARVLSATPDLTGALSDLNELRRHRITGYSDENITNAGELLDAIREERRKELCFEGHRWFDLRRYGMPSITHDFRKNKAEPMLRYTLRKEDPLYTLPFPRTVLERNTELEQNPSAFEPERAGIAIN